MARKISQFSKDMSALAEQIESGANKLVVKSTANAGKRVAGANPIDTGLSSGNWQASVGQPKRMPVASFMPGASIRRMSAFEATNKKSNQSSYLSNPIDYVRELNLFATSRQQPVPLWVERNAEAGIAETLKTAKIIGKI